MHIASVPFFPRVGHTPDPPFGAGVCQTARLISFSLHFFHHTGTAVFSDAIERHRQWFFSLVLLLVVLCPIIAHATDIQAKRIGYLEAGKFWLFDRTFTVFQQALATNSDIRCIYPEDAHKSPGWEPENMARLPLVASELMHRKDLDLIVGLGTAAVKALLAANTGQIPILGMAMADPVAAGVVTDISDSGVDNFTCRIVADRWSIMFRVFHDVVGFSKLGILYQNTPEGRIYSALDDANAMASELGFTVLDYGGLSSAETDDECRAGLEHLKKQGMDAFFIGPLNCFDPEKNDVGALLKQINDWKIPTFARDGSEYVEAGALMGFSTWNFGPTGEFLAHQAAAILKGALPRSLPMVDRIEPSIAINLATATTIGLHFPLDVLVVSDEIFENTRPAALIEEN